MGPDSKMNQPWAFWFQNFAQNLPPSGSGTVIDGSNTTYGQMTLYQGLDAAKGTPSLGDIYFALDTRKIYVESAGAWVTQLPAFTGDASTALGGTTITFNTVNNAVGTWGGVNSIPVITVNEKGLVTNVTLEPVAAGQSPGGPNFSVQYANGGVFDGNSSFTFDPGSQTLTLNNMHVGGTISFTNPVNTRTNLLPAQTGLAGQVLTTNGTDVSWEPTGTYELLFDYGDASPKNLITIPADKIIQSVSIIIMTPFDDTSTLSIGDAGDVDRLMETTDNYTEEAGTYTVEPAYKYGINTQLTLSITPGASTAGHGLVVITYQK